MKHVTRRGYRLNTNLGDLYNSYIIDLQNRQSRDSFWITWLTWFCVFTKRLNQKVTNDFQKWFPRFLFTNFAQIWADFDIFKKFDFSNSHHSNFFCPCVIKIARIEMVKLIHFDPKWSISDPLKNEFCRKIFESKIFTVNAVRNSLGAHMLILGRQF